jgi:hypothetical protein
MAFMADKMPELVLVAETDPAVARRARRLAGAGRGWMVGRLGLEPRTKALKGPCSTN